MTAKSRAEVFFLIPAWIPDRMYPSGKELHGMGLCRWDLEGVGLTVMVDENRLKVVGSLDVIFREGFLVTLVMSLVVGSKLWVIILSKSSHGLANCYYLAQNA